MRPAAIVAALFFTSSALATEPVDLTGRWSGSWESLGSGHRGPLSATFQRSDDTHYRVVFRGKFLKVIPFRYKADLEITGYDDDRVLLSGSQKLPFFGTFSYSAEATCTDFLATYYSRSDQGVFQMKRE